MVGEEEIRVFISYASEDVDFAKKLSSALKQHANISVWRDQESIPPGADWRQNIEDALKNATHILAIHSEASKESFYVKGEWVHGCDLDQYVIPIVIEGGTLHPYLEHLQAIYFIDESSFDAKVDELIAVLEGGPKSQPHPQPRVYKLFPSAGSTVYYPDFCNDYGINSNDLLESAHLVQYIGTIGYTVIVPNEQGLEDCLNNGGQLQILLAEKTELNLRIAASRSASPPDKRYPDLVKETETVTTTIRRIAQVNPSEVELRYLKFLPPFHMLLIDAETPNGKIEFGIYSYGRSTRKRTLRAGTTVRRDTFPDLVDHFCQMFNNAWADGSPIDISS